MVMVMVVILTTLKEVKPDQIQTTISRTIPPPIANTVITIETLPIETLPIVTLPIEIV